MKITTLIRWDIETGAVLEHDFYEYEGPLALCDRAAQAAAKTNMNSANGVAGQASQNAGQDRGTLFPTLRNDINNPTGFTPNQVNQNLTAAEQGAGGATGSLAGAQGLKANVTRNSSATAGVGDALARARAMAASKATGDITAESNKLGQMKRQSALSGLEGLYGTDNSDSLKAMGLSTDAINSEVNAGKSGWLQNMDDTITAAASAAKAIKPNGY